MSGQATETARRILDLCERHRHLITDKLGGTVGNGNRVLEYLYEYPIVSVSVVQNLIGTTYPPANNLVTRMVDCGILQEFTGQSRNRMFRYKDYIELFHDDPD